MTSLDLTTHAAATGRRQNAPASPMGTTTAQVLSRCVVPAGPSASTRPAPSPATVDLACGAVAHQRLSDAPSSSTLSDRLAPQSMHGPQRAEALCGLFWADSTSDFVDQLLTELTVARCALPDLPDWDLGVALRLVVVAAAADDYAECRSALGTGWLQLRRQAPAGLTLPDRVLSGQQYLKLRSALAQAGRYDPVLQHVRWYRQARPVFRKRRNSPAPEDVNTEIVGLFTFPGLYRLLESCPEILAAPANRPGRVRGYPVLMLLGLAFAARYTADHVSVARRLFSDGGQLYQRIVTAMTTWATKLNFPLPPCLPHVPPTKHQIEGFYKSVVKRGLVLPLCEALLPVAVRQAQMQGNLLPGSQPDWSMPSPWQVVYADGMFLKPYADARPDDADYLLREKARREAAEQGLTLEGDLLAGEPRRRIQAWHTNGSEDGKGKQHGINFLACHTRTEHGRITLAVDWARGAELHGARRMLDRVVAAADGGVHTIAYDRVFHGVLLDRFFTEHGVLFTNSNVSASRGKSDEAAESDTGHTADTQGASDDEPKAGAGRRSGGTGKAGGVRKPAKTLSQQARREIEQMVLRQLAEEGLDDPAQSHFHTRFDTLLRQYFAVAAQQQPVPVGLSFYDTSGGNVEVVRGKPFAYGAISHPGGDGTTCQHELYVDDGALWTVVEDPDPDTENELPVKHTALRCLSAVLDPDPRTGRPRLRSRWQLDCLNGTHIEDILWIPHTDEASSRGKPTERDKAIASLRPLNRTNPAMYWLIAGRREDAESSHSQYQLHALPREGRAASLHPEQQLLDYLAHAVTVNANTWRRFCNDGS